MDDLLLQLLPSLVIGFIYAVLVFIVARKRRVNPWGWTIATLIPVVGLLVSAVFFFLTFLSVLDRLNALEGRTGGS
jgi:ATP/ADP translocase